MWAFPVAAQDNSAELIEVIVGLLADEDADMRSLAYEQVRSEAIGSAATTAFASKLADLNPEAQVGLLRALTMRGDQAARPEILALLAKSGDISVRVAAIESLGKLGEPDDATLLVQTLAKSSGQEQAAAMKSLIDLRGDSVAPLLVAELKRIESPIRVKAIEILILRRELNAISDIAAIVTDNNQTVRGAAMMGLSKLAGPEQIPAMLKGILKATPGKESDAAEKYLVSVCNRVEDPDERAKLVLAAMETMTSSEQTKLLSALGRVGGSVALKTIVSALDNPRTHSEGLRAICNWPDASVATKLIELIEADMHPGHATTALRALIRVAPLADDRTDDERLELLKKAMTMCTRDTERIFILDRCRTIRTLDSLNYVLSFVNQPKFAEQACLSIVEMAHHREFRDANKAVFMDSLDQVIATSKNAVTVDRAQRYKEGKTWVRPSS
jgi:HEAT repeat protein